MKGVGITLESRLHGSTAIALVFVVVLAVETVTAATELPGCEALTISEQNKKLKLLFL